MERNTFLAVILGAVFGGLLGFFGPIVCLLLLYGNGPDESLIGWSCFLAPRLAFLGSLIGYILAPCLAFLGSVIGYILAEEVGFRKSPPVSKDDTREPDDIAEPGPSDANGS